MSKAFHIIALFLLFALPGTASGQSPQEVHESATRSIATEASAQEDVLHWTDKRDGLSSEIRDLKLMDAWLEFQITKYKRYIARQEAVIEELKLRKEEAKRIGMELEPYLEVVVDRLEERVAEDPPFLPEERAQRIAFLRESLDDYHLSLSEKLRRVLEALQVETEYGRSVETTSRELALNGVPTRVAVLRLGRSGLYYLTEDGSKAGFWDRGTKSWRPLEPEFARTLLNAREMAERKRALELLVLPIGETQ